MQELLKCTNLSKNYGAGFVLDDINISLPTGRIIGLLGPNGSGKTTFLKICAGLLSPTKGGVTIDGNPVGVDTKRIVSYLPEQTYLSNAMTVSDCIELFNDFYDDFDDETAVNMLRRLSVPLKARLKTLSKGTKEKVQLVLVMSRKAKLFLLDEPIGGVDPAARDIILDMILSNFNPDATIIISTHLIYDIERVLDEFIFLRNGKIAAYDIVDNVRTQYGKSVDELFREAFRC
ncbi:MAG: ABC transporter ATP-binding protein [Clostridiales bacterium]|nr:ABC transporter ATP-binding protein [Clostridiales bacterium]MDY5753995.1 ABC transporter ATP-binding protein [Eubacteriales bacterium]